MKAPLVILITLTLALPGGCQKNLNWTPLDGSSSDAARLAKARKACRIEIKLAGLERARDDRDRKLDSASTNAAEMNVRDEYKQIKRQVYREIDACMRKQGYAR